MRTPRKGDAIEILIHRWREAFDNLRAAVARRESARPEFSDYQDTLDSVREFEILERAARAALAEGLRNGP